MMSASDLRATFNSRPVSDNSRDAQRMTVPRMLSAYTTAVIAKLRDLAPYAAIELILPGGSVMALLLWFYRRHKKTSPSQRIARRFGAEYFKEMAER
jgi:hypothetical protein